METSGWSRDSRHNWRPLLKCRDLWLWTRHIELKIIYHNIIEWIILTHNSINKFFTQKKCIKLNYSSMKMYYYCDVIAKHNVANHAVPNVIVTVVLSLKLYLNAAQLLHTWSIHAPQWFHKCSIIATQMQHKWSIIAPQMLLICSTNAAFHIHMYVWSN